MTESPNNRMVGSSPHIRNIGPHTHQWMQAGAIGSEVYEACELCGTRRVRGALTGHSVQAAWVAGGVWEGAGQHPTPMPPSVLWGQAEYVNTHAEHEARARAVDVVEGTKTGEGDNVVERRELEPGQLAEERGHPLAEPEAQPEPEPEVAEEPAAVEEPAEGRKGRGRR